LSGTVFNDFHIVGVLGFAVDGHAGFVVGLGFEGFVMAQIDLGNRRDVGDGGALILPYR
jgi:hypothetical protein